MNTTWTPATADEDRLSALPDDFLRCILTRARCIRTAIRTSALSRRWRLVWTQLREISFVDRADRPHFTPAVVDAIRAALFHDRDDLLDRVDIDVAYDGVKLRPYPAGRVAGPLRLAARRLAGELNVEIKPAETNNHVFDLIQKELPLPVCDRATSIHVHIAHYNLRPTVARDAGTFAALRVLTVACYAFHRLDVARLLQTQCPRLQELTLAGLLGSGGIRDLAIRSACIERIELHNVLDGRFIVEAPRLVRLLVSDCQFRDDDDDLLNDDYSYACKKAARIVAPKLAELIKTHSPRYCNCRRSKSPATGSRSRS